MKKVKLICMSAVMTLMLSSTTFVQAAGNTLDIDNAINKAVENSYQIKNKDIEIEKAKNSYKDATRGKGGNDVEEKYNIYQYTNLKEVAKNGVKLNVYNQYAAFINAKQALDLETQKFQNAEAKYKRAQLQMSLGLIGKPDLKSIEQTYYTEKSQLDKAQRTFDSVTKNINQVVGFNISDTYIGFTKDILEEKPSIKTYDEYVKDALNNRAEILNDTEKIKLEKLNFAGINANLGVSLTTNSPEYIIGKYSVTYAENQLETDKINISIEINGLYNDLQSKVQKLQSLTTNYNAEKKKYNEALQRYNLGMISKIDFEDSLSSFKGVENSLKSAQRDVYLAKLKLEYASGIGTGTQSSN
ncbi:MAG: TolC family protein [Clostridiaceae bacterium]|nr:TolC family protein [Clostridiaceae bacterium]